jgi:predicted DCC family thiol-disulfide oxidoreductase YuxK
MATQIEPPTFPVVRFTVRGVPRDAGPGGDAFFSTAGSSGVGEGRPFTVVYDGHCKVCGRLVGVLRVWDRATRRLEIIPSQTPGLADRFPWIPARAYGESLQVVGPGGRTWERGAAVEQIIDVLPRGRWVGWVFSLPGVRAATDQFYRWFARNRYRLGCGAHCSYRADTAGTVA